MRTRAWLLLSGVAHGALALLLSVVDPPAPGRVLAPASAAITIDVQVAPESVTEPSGPPAEAESAPQESPRRPRASAPRPAPASTPQPSTPPEDAPQPSSPAHVDTSVITLSPRAAALSMMELDTASDAGVVRPGPLRGDAQRTLEDALMSAVLRVDTRNEPVLRPKAGGGFTYAGNGFEASIENDGSVKMEDKFVHAKWHFKPVMGENGEVAGFRLFELSYDIFGWLDRKMGNDPFRSERRWFMDHTRGLREDLMEHFHDRRVHSRQGSPDGTPQ